MKKSPFIVNTLLAAITLVYCLVLIVLKALDPSLIIPKWDVPTIVALGAAALALERYMVIESARSRIISIILATITLTALPLISGISEVVWWKLGLISGVTYGIVSVLYDSMAQFMPGDRMRFFTPAAYALILYLAVQGMQGVLL